MQKPWLKTQTNPEVLSLNPTGLSALIRTRGFRSPNNDQAKWIVQDKNCQSKSDYHEEAFHLKKGEKFSNI